MSDADLALALQIDVPGAHQARLRIAAAAETPGASSLILMRGRLVTVSQQKHATDAALVTAQKELAATRSALAIAETGLAERAYQLQQFATAENDVNRSIDALSICAQFASSKWCHELRAVGSLCCATRAEEALWSAMTRVRHGKTGRTFLMYAARFGMVERVRWLLARGAPRNDSTFTNEKQTALHDAAFYGHTDVVDALVAAADIELDALDHDGDTPLHWAALGGHIGAVRALLAAGASVDVASNDYADERHTPLTLACESSSLDVVQELLRAGADPNGYGKSAKPPLAWAARGRIEKGRGNPEIVSALLAAGADVHVRFTESLGIHGRTSIHGVNVRSSTHVALWPKAL